MSTGVSDRCAVWLPSVVVAAATCASFWPAHDAQFVLWDDDQNFLKNTAYRGLSATHLHWMFTTFHMGPYQPLAWLTLGLDFVLWGMNPHGYHITSIGIHALAAAAFYFLARRLLAVTARSVPRRALVGETRASGRADEWRLSAAAAFAAVIFAIHPLRCESVAWVTERRDVLCGLFAVLALAAYLRYTEADKRHATRGAPDAGHATSHTAHVKPPPNQRPRHQSRDREGAVGTVAASGRGTWYGLSLAAMAAAGLSKGLAMTLPLVMLVLDFWPLRRWALSPGETEQGSPMLLRARRVRQCLLEKAPFFLLAAIFAVLAYHGQASMPGTLRPLSHYGVTQRIAQGCYAVLYYPWRTVMPIRLLPIYDMPESFNPLAPRFLAVMFAAPSVTALLFWGRRRWPAGLAIWLAYLAMLAPVMGLVKAGSYLVADRYSFLACMPLAVLAGGLLQRGLGAASSSSRRAPRDAQRAIPAPIAAGLSIAVSIGLAIATWRQTRVWHDTEALWTHALTIDPGSWQACQILGTARAQQASEARDPAVTSAKCEEAIALFQRGYSTRPHPDFLLLLARCHALLADVRQDGRRHDLDEAVRYGVLARHACRVNGLSEPRLGREYALVLVRHGRAADALPELERLVREDPASTENRTILDDVLHQVKPVGK